MQTKHDVVVNGAGPVGLALACELARHGVDFQIFEKRHEASAESRALAIFPRTLEVFETLGVLDQVIEEGQRLHAICLHNRERQLARVDFQGIDSPFKFAIALPQSRTERILEARLEKLGAKVGREHELKTLSQDAAMAWLRFAQPGGAEVAVEAGWLVGCDGAHSAVRHALGMEFQGAQYEEEFLLADVRIESDMAPDEAHLFFGPEGVLACFPFANGRGRIIADQRAPHGVGEPALEEIQAIVSARSGRPIRVSDDVWKAWFHISHRIVQHYRRGRCLLAGDAAHIHSPAGGQGMNTGIQDAFNLGWKLALVSRGLAAPALVDSYEAERMPVARAVMNLADRMTRVATAQHGAAKGLRDLVVPLLSGIPFVREAMAESLSEVAIDYRGSPWVENHGFGSVRAGDRAPDVVLFDRAARVERRLFDLLREPGFVLLAFDGYTGSHPGESVLRGLPGRVYRVAKPGQETLPGVLEDRDCKARELYGVEANGLFILIRPDGYIGYRGENPGGLAGYIHHLQGA